MNINFLEHRLSLAAGVLMLSACGGGSVSVPTNQSPVANVVASKTTAFAGEVVTLNAGASADADGNIVSYVWTFSDGSARITTSTPAVQSKSWATAGA